MDDLFWTSPVALNGRPLWVWVQRSIPILVSVTVVGRHGGGSDCPSHRIVIVFVIVGLPSCVSILISSLLIDAVYHP